MFGLFKKKPQAHTPGPWDKPAGGVNLSKRTLACLVLDESGSMAHLTKDTIGGVNKFIDSLKNDEGDEVLFSFYTFDSGGGRESVRALYKSKSITEVKHITNKDYRPSGGTPLYDAVGKAIADMEQVAKDGELVIFAILTDGEENSSHEYRADQIKASIQRLEQKGWKFSFLGVGIDAYSTYSNMGASVSNSFNLGASAKAVGATYAAMSANTATMRSAYSANNLQATAGLNVILTKDTDNIK